MSAILRDDGDACKAEAGRGVGGPYCSAGKSIIFKNQSKRIDCARRGRYPFGPESESRSVSISAARPAG